MMKKDDQCQRLISIGAAILFAAIALVVLVAFEPTRDLFCARYDARGIGGLIATFAGEDPSCLRNFLYDYQTLLTGVLAVGAAATTVGVMVATEKAAQRRHNEIREEANAERHRLLQAGALRYLVRIAKLSFFLKIDQKDLAKTNRRERSAEDLSSGISNMFKDIRKMLNEPLFKRVAVSLSPEAMVAATVLSEMAQDWSVQRPEEDPIFSVQFFRPEVDRALRAMEIIEAELMKVSIVDEQAERVANLYDWIEHGVKVK